MKHLPILLLFALLASCARELSEEEIIINANDLFGPTPPADDTPQASNNQNSSQSPPIQQGTTKGKNREETYIRADGKVVTIVYDDDGNVKFRHWEEGGKTMIDFDL